MNAFQNALSTGKVVVRRWWVNRNNSDQVTVQFFQLLDTGAGPVNLISIAQGTTPKQTISALYSFKREIAESKLGSTEGSFVDSDMVMFGSELFGVDVSIKITENFAPNPYSKSHEPKINPSTGEVVVSYNAETGTNDPVYRHTELVAGIINPSDHVLIRPEVKATTTATSKFFTDFLSR